jgi:hypothetical protein
MTGPCRRTDLPSGHHTHIDQFVRHGFHNLKSSKMDDSSSGLDNLGSFIRFTGATVPARARYIGESLSGLALGLVCGQVGSNIAGLGPLVPFIFGTWVRLCSVLCIYVFS